MKTSNFNIIAGKYRRAKFNFDGDTSLRPTLNKVRETLFNWLNFDIIDKSVLDAFAGSGALGFEALSRGAKSVVLIEKNPKTSYVIQTNIEKLNHPNITLQAGDFFTQVFTHKFDIILLDPPFNLGLVDKSIDFIIKNNMYHQDTLIYIESEYEVHNPNLETIKQKKSASVYYQLAKIPL